MTTKKIKLLAKPIVKNKFYIVENNGEKVGTIQVHPEGATYVCGDARERFPSVKMLGAKHNITFNKTPDNHSEAEPRGSVYGFPCDGAAFHKLWEVTRNLPVFTKSQKSKSQYCAGHYLVKFHGQWTHAFCPKMITLDRYEFQGPFMTRQAAMDHLKTL